MEFLGRGGRLQYETEIVCGGDMPGSVLLHDEGEILGVVVRVVGQDIENHTQEELVHLDLRDGKQPAGGKEVFVVVGLGVDGGERLREDFLPGVTVETLSQKVTGPIHIDQSGGHHRDAGPGGQVVPRLLDLGEAELRGVEFEDIILPVASGGCLSGEDIAILIHCDDRLLEAPAGGCADGHQGFLRQGFFRRNDCALPVLLDLPGQIIQLGNDEFLVRAEGVFAAGDEFERAHGAAPDEGELRQRSLVFLVEVMLREPLVEKGVAPVVRK